MAKITSTDTFDLTMPNGQLVRINQGDNTVDADVAAHYKAVFGDKDLPLPPNEMANQSPGVLGAKKDILDPASTDDALDAVDAGKNADIGNGAAAKKA